MLRSADVIRRTRHPWRFGCAVVLVLTDSEAVHISPFGSRYEATAASWRMNRSSMAAEWEDER